MKKQVIISFIFVVLLFLISFLFAFFHIKNREKNKEPLFIKYDTSQVITISNKLPLSDALGKKIDNGNVQDNIQGYVTFEVKNPNKFPVFYEIYLTKEEIDTSQIKDNYIKFYLTNDSDVPYNGFEKNRIPSYNEFLYLSDKPTSKLLYRGVLNKNSTEKLKLRSWLSDSYVIADYIEEFSVKVHVRIK